MADQQKDLSPVGRLLDHGALGFEAEPSAGDGVMVPLQDGVVSDGQADDNEGDDQDQEGPAEEDFRRPCSSAQTASRSARRFPRMYVCT